MDAHFVKFLLSPTIRPFTIMACAIVVLGIMDRGHGYFFSVGTIFSVMQLFATFGLVALGLGLSMLVREFDLSVAGMVGLAGCIAVMTGVENPWLGVAARRRRRRCQRRAARPDHDAARPELGRRHARRPAHAAGHHLRADREQDHQLSQHGRGARAQRADRQSPVGAQRRRARGVRARRAGDDLHPYRPRRDRNRQRPARQPDRRAEHRPRHHRRVRGLGRVGGAWPACC